MVVGWLVGGRVGGWVGSLVGWLVGGWVGGWVFGWLVGWLVGWLGCCWKRYQSPGAFVMVDSGSSGGDSGIPLMGVVGMPGFWSG